MFTLNVVMLNVIPLNVVMLNVIMLNVVMLNVVMLNVAMLSVVMLNVVAPLTKEKGFCVVSTLKTILMLCVRHIPSTRRWRSVLEEVEMK
jgi:hypothetical protein